MFPDPAGCVPERARPDAQRRRGFRIGCTADGAEDRCTWTSPCRPSPSCASWGSGYGGRRGAPGDRAARPRPPYRAGGLAHGRVGTRDPPPLPDYRLGTPLLPLRVAGKTDGQRRVLAAAEQMVVALRSVFACDPRPGRMREPVPTGSGRLLGGCDNLADVLWRTRAECGRRHAQFVTAVRAGCAGPVEDVLAEPGLGGVVRALLDRGDGVRTGLARLGYGELRYLALALVLFTGPGVLEVDPAGEVPAALQTLTVLADGFDRGLDVRQRAELLRLAARMCDRGHIRFVGAVADASWVAGAAGEAGADGAGGVTVVHLNP
ncbi:ATP-binding protein [Streptomyces violaceorubidus]